MELIKRQKWENLFKRRELVHTDAVKEFYAKMSVIHLKKKDIVKSKVRGVEIEFDHEKLATILGIPGTMGSVIPRFGKRDTTSFMDLTYMDHLVNRRRINLPRVMMRHMAYVISVKDQELPYGDWMTMIFEAFGVPLVIKKGEEPKKYDFFEDTFLTMCKLTEREWNMVDRKWRERRRDNDGDAPEVEAEDEDEGNKDDFDWEAVIDEATVEGESGSDDQFYDAQLEVEEPSDETPRRPSSSSFIFSSAERSRTFRSRPLGSH
ncbi:hypothetical protein Dimus_033095 [Dionaea muscipula]